MVCIIYKSPSRGVEFLRVDQDEKRRRIITTVASAGFPQSQVEARSVGFLWKQRCVLIEDRKNVVAKLFLTRCANYCNACACALPALLRWQSCGVGVEVDRQRRAHVSGVGLHGWPATTSSAHASTLSCASGLPQMPPGMLESGCISVAKSTGTSSNSCTS